MVDLPHGIGNFGRVLLSGKMLEKISKENQGTSKGEDTYGEKHNEKASRGTADKYPGKRLLSQ